MKKKIVVIFFVWLFLSLDVQSQSYSYPIIPGTDAWNNLESYSNRVNASQIPEDILLSMSTRELIETCFEHPFAINILAYEDRIDAISSMVAQFNVYSEVVNRSDVVKIASEVINEQSSMSLISSDSAFKSNLKLLIAQSIIEYASNDLYAAETISDMYVEVRTPNGSIVPDCYLMDASYSDAYISEQDSWWRARYPECVLLSSSTPKYNCHAYAWHMTEGGSELWMGTSSNPTSIYWIDNSYKQINSKLNGLKVAYLSDNHSAVTTATVDVFVSKWGSGPLMRHHKNDSPYNNTNLKYYIKNTVISGQITGRYAQNSVWKTLNTVNQVSSRTSPITLNVNYVNAYLIEWELIEGGTDVAFGEQSLGVVNIIMNSSRSVGVKAIAYTPMGKVESAFYFFCNN